MFSILNLALCAVYYCLLAAPLNSTPLSQLDYCNFLPEDQRAEFDCPPSSGTSQEPKTIDPDVSVPVQGNPMELVDDAVMEEICPAPPCHFLSPDKALSGNAFEGDIDGMDEATNLTALGSGGGQANAIRDESKHWPNATVPYMMGKPFLGNTEAKKLIMEAIDVFHKETCVRFIPRTNESNYIYVAGSFQCSSYSGKTGGRQVFQLSLLACMTTGIIQHELMHALGFFHEQSRSDRDQYVEINWDNMHESKKLQFQAYQEAEVISYGEPYDFGSILHYGMYDFAQDPKVWTIRPKAVYSNETSKIGQRIRLSPIDIRKINAMYKCEKPGPCNHGQGWAEINGYCYFFSLPAGLSYQNFDVDSASLNVLTLTLTCSFGSQKGRACTITQQVGSVYEKQSLITVSADGVPASWLALATGMTYVHARNYCRKLGDMIGSPHDDVITGHIVPFMQKNKISATEAVWLEGCRTFSIAKPDPADAESCDTVRHFTCQRKAASRKSKKFIAAA